MKLDVLRAGTLGVSAFAVVSALAMPAYAQDADDGRTGLQDIIVTAQKREQSLQDVPIAVTAITGDALASNRVVTVSDLTGLAPGVTVRSTAGGSKLPSFSVRGAVSYGVTPGTDKQVSLYLDGVYISSPRGSIFDLPDVSRIEILRGPQGTLFGRNATAGAVSISTREPTGEIGVKASFTVGNYDNFRMRTSVELPRVGPLSGYVSFLHDYKRGDVENAGAGLIWNRTAAADKRVAKIQRSPKYLGTKDVDAWFGVLKFESGDFTTTYRYDRSEDNGTPEATGVSGYNSSIPLLGGFLDALVNSQPDPVHFAADGKRPKIVDNAWVVPIIQRVQGHNLTSTLRLTDDLSIKNILAYRQSYIFSPSSLDGLSTLTFTPQAVQPYATFIAYSTIPNLGSAPIAQQVAAIQAIAGSLQPVVGSPFIGIAQQTQGRSKQWSDELQVNYASDLVTITAGALWFHSKDWAEEHLLQPNASLAPVFGGVITQQNAGTTFNKATSIAAYTQLEFHLNEQIDIVGGARITQDKKSGSFSYGNPPSLAVIPFTYKKTKPNYLIGVNYSPSGDLLIYGKYSTAFVSGGSVGGISFEPETAKSWEAGVKATLLDRRLRINLAAYHVTYRNYQSAQSSANYREQIGELTGDPNRANVVNTFVIGQGGPVKTKGFEMDFSAAPSSGLQVGGSLGYTTTSFSDVNPVILAANGGVYLPESYRPDWTGSLWVQYETRPLMGDAYLSFRVDGNWQNDLLFAQNPGLPAYDGYAKGILKAPAYWLVNGRAALQDLDIGGVKTQVALWGKNLTNERAAGFAFDLGGIFGVANYIPARTYGVDFTIEF